MRLKTLPIRPSEFPHTAHAPRERGDPKTLSGNIIANANHISSNDASATSMLSTASRHGRRSESGARQVEDELLAWAGVCVAVLMFETDFECGRDHKTHREVHTGSSMWVNFSGRRKMF